MRVYCDKTSEANIWRLLLKNNLNFYTLNQRTKFKGDSASWEWLEPRITVGWLQTANVSIFAVLSQWRETDIRS